VVLAVVPFVDDTTSVVLGFMVAGLVDALLSEVLVTTSVVVGVVVTFTVVVSVVVAVSVVVGVVVAVSVVVGVGVATSVVFSVIVVGFKVVVILLIDAVDDLVGSKITVVGFIVLISSTVTVTSCAKVKIFGFLV